MIEKLKKIYGYVDIIFGSIVILYMIMLKVIGFHFFKDNSTYDTIFYLLFLGCGVFGVVRGYYLLKKLKK